MKSLIPVLVLIISVTAFASPSQKKATTTTTKMKVCLAQLHAAQKAYYNDKHVYTDDPKELGFSSDACDGIDRIEVSLSNNGKRYMAAATKGRKLATIDDQKNLSSK